MTLLFDYLSVVSGLGIRICFDKGMDSIEFVRLVEKTIYCRYYITLFLLAENSSLPTLISTTHPVKKTSLKTQ